MLWSPENIKLQSNYKMPLRRLHFLDRRLQKDAKLHQKYKEAMARDIRNGYSRKLWKREVDEVGRKTWYLSNNTVFNENKPSKMRIVFDANKKNDKISFNNAFLTGSDLLNNLADIWLRFRNYETAVATDIEAMYHQAKVGKDVIAIYQMVVYIFGVKDSLCCPNYAPEKSGRDHFD